MEEIGAGVVWLKIRAALGCTEKDTNNIIINTLSHSTKQGRYKDANVHVLSYFSKETYKGRSICNENPIITPSTNASGFYAICQTKDRSVIVIMVHETLFYLSKFNKLQTFLKAH